MSTLSQFAQTGKIKSIQRGTISVGPTSTTASAIISSVDTTKSILYYLGQNNATKNTLDAYDSSDRSAYLTLTNSTTVTASGAAAFSSLYTETLVISWQLVEYY